MKDKYPALYETSSSFYQFFFTLLQGNMRLVHAILVLLLKVCLTVQCTSIKNLTEYYKNYEIIPDVLDEAPYSLLKVSYNGKDLEFGKELTPREVKDAPVVEWDADALSFYTLIMNEPDAPSRKDRSLGECLHWLVSNIPGNDIGKGEIVVGYLGSAPPKNNQLHRYVLTVYKQFSKLSIKENHIGPYQLEGRLHWSLRNYVNQNDLEKPIAGNMYLCQYDDYVPEVFQKLGFNI